MEAHLSPVRTTGSADLETIMVKPHDGSHIVSWGSRNNNPTDTGVVVGAQFKAFQKAENIGTVSDGVPKREYPGGPITTWEFIYPYKEVGIISYLRGSNLDEFENQNQSDPNAKFPDVIPKLRVLLGKVLPSTFRKHASDPMVSFALNNGDMEALNRYDVLFDAYREWKKQTGGFVSFQSDLFPQKVEQAFSRLRDVYASDDLESLKTAESNRSYRSFVEYNNKVLDLDAKAFFGDDDADGVFIRKRDELLKGLGRGLVELASDGSDIFSFFQIKKDPEKVTQEAVLKAVDGVAKEVGTFPQQLEKAFYKVADAVDSQSLDSLKTPDADLPYKYFDELFNEIRGLEPSVFLQRHDGFIPRMTTGLLEVVVGNHDVFSLLQIKETPHKVAYETTVKLLKEFSSASSAELYDLVGDVLGEHTEAFSDEMDSTPLHELSQKKEEFKEHFRDLLYRKLLNSSPVLLLANPGLIDESGLSALDQGLDAFIRASLFEKSFFGRVYTEVKNGESKDYQRHFLDEFFKNYMSGGFEYTAASDLFTLIPEAVRGVKGQQMSPLHKKDITRLIGKLEGLPEGQILWSGHESAQVTGKNLKNALVGTIRRMYEETFDPKGHVFRTMKDDSSRIESAAANVHRIATIANAISSFDYSLFDASHLIPTPQQLIAGLEERTEYIFELQEAHARGTVKYNTSEKNDFEELSRAVKMPLESKVIAPLSEEKKELYGRIAKQMKDMDALAASFTGSNAEELKEELGKLAGSFTWSKEAPAYDPVQSDTYSQLVAYAEGLADSLPSKIPAKMRPEKVSEWSALKSQLMTSIDPLDKSSAVYESVSGMIDSVGAVVEGKLGKKAPAPVVKQGLASLAESMKPYVVEYPIGNPLKEKVYAHLTESSEKFYDRMKKSINHIIEFLDIEEDEAKMQGRISRERSTQIKDYTSISRQWKLSSQLSSKLTENDLAFLGEIEGFVRDSVSGTAPVPQVCEGIAGLKEKLETGFSHSTLYKNLMDYFNKLDTSFQPRRFNEMDVVELKRRWTSYSEELKRAYDTFVGGSDKLFLDDIKAFFAEVDSSIQSAKTVPDLAKVGIKASGVSSQTVYLVPVGDKTERCTAESLNSLDALSKIWSVDCVSSFVEKAMFDRVDQSFISPVRALLDSNSSQARDGTAHAFDQGYKAIRASLGEELNGQVLGRIDEFYKKAKWSNKLEDIRSMNNKWDKMYDDLDAFSASIKGEASAEYKRFVEEVVAALDPSTWKHRMFKNPPKPIDLSHPVFVYKPDKPMDAVEYRPKETSSAITEALKSEGLRSNDPFDDSDTRSLQDMMIDAVPLLSASLSTEQVKYGMNDPVLGGYVSKLFASFSKAYFGEDPDAAYKIVKADGKNVLVVSELDPKLAPERVFGAYLVVPCSQGDKQRLAISLPYQEALPDGVSSLLQYEMFRAGSEFEKGAVPSREFLSRAGSLIHTSVGEAVSGLIDAFGSRFSYHNE